MQKMKVAIYYNNSDVKIQDMPIPEINDDELLVKVMASGICGSDVMEWYRVKKAPLVLGHEIAGDIVKAGKTVKKFKVGDRVFVTHHVPCDSCHYCLNDQHTLCETLRTTKFYPGGFAQYLRVPKINVEKGTFLLPDGMSYDEGTFIEPLACTVRGFRVAGFNANQTVLVLGSGIAGILNIQLAKGLGAKKIIATDIDKYRLDAAKKFGAEHAINAKENVPELVKKYNEGRLADLVILCAGAFPAVKQALDSVDNGGTILLFALPEPGNQYPMPLFDLWNRQIKIVSTYAGVKRDILEAIELIKTKKVTVSDMISHKLPLSETAKGFKLTAQAKKSMKIIIEPNKLLKK